MYVKLKKRVSISVGPDETALEPSHLDLYCLQKPITIASGSKRVRSTLSRLNRFITVFMNIYVKLYCFKDKLEDPYADRTYVSDYTTTSV